MNDKHNILLIDNETNVINALKRELRREPYNIIAVQNADMALSMLQNRAVQVVIADLRLQGMSGIDLMEKIKNLYPHTIRVILSGYTDIDSVAEAINKGHIYKYLLKPWDKLKLKDTIRQCLDLYELKKQNRILNAKIKSQNKELKYLNKNLELEVQRRTAALVEKNKELNLSYEILEHLPIGVISTTTENKIVFANGMAKLYFERDQKQLLNTRLEQHFDKELIVLAQAASQTYLPQRMKYFYNPLLTFHVKCAPLSSELNNRGVIISFIELQ